MCFIAPIKNIVPPVMFIDKFSVALSFQNLKNVDISILECEIYFNIFITFSTPDNLPSYIRGYR